MATIQDWFQDLPPVTRTLLVSVIGTTCGVSFGYLDPASFAFIWPKVYSDFEVWRIFTCFIFFGKFSFPFLIQTYMLVQYSNLYESDPYDTGAGGTSADYLWMLAIGAFILCVLGCIFMSPFLGPSLSFMILYVWTKKNSERQSNFFGFNVQALYLPWVLVAFNLLIGNDISMSILGIAAGHIYYFLLYIVPGTYGVTCIRTPALIMDMFGAQRSIPPGGARPGEPRAVQRPRGGHTWGTGQVLGGT